MVSSAGCVTTRCVWQLSASALAGAWNQWLNELDCATVRIMQTFFIFPQYCSILKCSQVQVHVKTTQVKVHIVIQNDKEQKHHNCINLNTCNVSLPPLLWNFLSFCHLHSIWALNSLLLPITAIPTSYLLCIWSVYHIQTGKQIENSGDGRFPGCPRLPLSSRLTDTLITPWCMKVQTMTLSLTQTHRQTGLTGAFA